jgi:membrane-associated protease RseP (regulator of RpoE activity)
MNNPFGTGFALEDPLLESEPGAPPFHVRRTRSRLIVHGGLIVLAFLTTTILSSEFLSGGSGWLDSSRFAETGFWSRGLLFSIPFFAILGTHELGHYRMARRHGLEASLPLFIPLPIGIGTAGAFIRLRTPFRNRRELFDVGFAGPLAGFAVALPVLVVGLARSRPLDSVGPDGTTVFGPTLATAALEAILPNLSGAEVVDYHPMAWAGWFGLFLTALNLLPMGQFDGGHILYAISPRLHRRLALPFAAFLVLLAVATRQPIWALWGILGLTLLRRHPDLAGAEPDLGPVRRRLALLALVIFVLSFTPVPLLEVTSR